MQRFPITTINVDPKEDPSYLETDHHSMRTKYSMFTPKITIGMGQFGNVLLGSLPNGKYIAIKQVKVSNVQEGQTNKDQENNFLFALNMLKNEQNILEYIEATRTNKNIPYYFFTDAYEKNNIITYNFVMECTNAGTLEQWILSGDCKKTSWDIKKRILRHIIKGISSLHDCKIFYRDLRSSNVLLNVEKNKLNAKIADFGISIKENDPFLNDMWIPKSRSAPETYYYAHNFSFPSDIYSYSITMFEIASSKSFDDFLKYFNNYKINEWCASTKPNNNLDESLEFKNFLAKSLFEQLNDDTPPLILSLMSSGWSTKVGNRLPAHEIINILKSDLNFVPPSLEKYDFLKSGEDLTYPGYFIDVPKRNFNFQSTGFKSNEESNEESKAENKPESTHSTTSPLTPYAVGDFTLSPSRSSSITIPTIESDVSEKVVNPINLLLKSEQLEFVDIIGTGENGSALVYAYKGHKPPLAKLTKPLNDVNYVIVKRLDRNLEKHGFKKTDPNQVMQQFLVPNKTSNGFIISYQNEIFIYEYLMGLPNSLKSGPRAHTLKDANNNCVMVLEHLAYAHDNKSLLSENLKLFINRCVNYAKISKDKQFLKFQIVKTMYANLHALTKLHSAGIVHLDIALRNAVIDHIDLSDKEKPIHVNLIDYGLSKKMNDQNECTLNNSTRTYSLLIPTFTYNKAVVQQFQQQINDGNEENTLTLSVHTDLYAMRIVFIELLSLLINIDQDGFLKMLCFVNADEIITSYGEHFRKHALNLSDHEKLKHYLNYLISYAEQQKELGDNICAEVMIELIYEFESYFSKLDVEEKNLQFLLKKDQEIFKQCHDEILLNEAKQFYNEHNSIDYWDHMVNQFNKLFENYTLFTGPTTYAPTYLNTFSLFANSESKSKKRAAPHVPAPSFTHSL